MDGSFVSLLLACLLGAAFPCSRLFPHPSRCRTFARALAVDRLAPTIVIKPSTGQLAEDRLAANWTTVAFLANGRARLSFFPSLPARRLNLM